MSPTILRSYLSVKIKSHRDQHFDKKKAFYHQTENMSENNTNINQNKLYMCIHEIVIQYNTSMKYARVYSTHSYHIEC